MLEMLVLLDAIKAFHRVEYVKLFELPIRRVMYLLKALIGGKSLCINQTLS